MCDPGSQAKHGGSIAVKMVLTDCCVHLVWALLWTLPALVVYPWWDQTFIMLIALWIVLEHKLLRACQVDSVFSLAIGNSQTCKFVLLLLRTQASVWCVQWCGADCFKAVCDRTAFEKVLLHHPQVRPWNDSGNTNLVITHNYKLVDSYGLPSIADMVSRTTARKIVHSKDLQELRYRHKLMLKPVLTNLLLFQVFVVFDASYFFWPPGAFV